MPKSWSQSRLIISTPRVNRLEQVFHLPHKGAVWLLVLFKPEPHLFSRLISVFKQLLFAWNEILQVCVSREMSQLYWTLATTAVKLHLLYNTINPLITKDCKFSTTQVDDGFHLLSCCSSQGYFLNRLQCRSAIIGSYTTALAEKRTIVHRMVKFSVRNLFIIQC